MTDSRPRLSVDGVCKTFVETGGRVTQALDQVSFALSQGEFAVLVGHNGSGKSTLLNVLYGSLVADVGTVDIFSGEGATEIKQVGRKRRAELISRVEQDTGRGVVLDLTVWENLHLVSLRSKPASPLGWGDQQSVWNRFGPVLTALGLADRLRARVADLSVGQRQLVALMMALECRPPLLLLDEYTAALDRQNADMCMKYAVDLCRQLGTTVLAVTHDLVQALQYGDTILVLREGRLVDRIEQGRKKHTSLAGLAEVCGYRFGLMPQLSSPSSLRE